METRGSDKTHKESDNLVIYACESNQETLVTFKATNSDLTMKSGSDMTRQVSIRHTSIRDSNPVL